MNFSQNIPVTQRIVRKPYNKVIERFGADPNYLVEAKHIEQLYLALPECQVVHEIFARPELVEYASLEETKNRSLGYSIVCRYSLNLWSSRKARSLPPESIV
ncbi:hypothetical protein J6590_094090 [Homalodisca vitripennis]|nr:hypothetical protein J6590_094090 [Homalodisca vitripennis]